jgi:HemY protein
MTAAAAALLVLFSALVASLMWRLMIWLLAMPRRAERARLDRRRREAGEVLARGFLSAAAGDGAATLPPIGGARLLHLAQAAVQKLAQAAKRP